MGTKSKLKKKNCEIDREMYEKTGIFSILKLLQHKIL